MKGLGERLRARARELGYSDSNVAKLVGVGQTRYANYVTDRHEPDLQTLLRICSKLRCTPSDLLAWPAQDGEEEARLSARIGTALAALDVPAMSVLAAVADGLVATTPLKRDPRPARTREPSPPRDGAGSEAEA